MRRIAVVCHMRLNHVAIAVPNLEAAAASYRLLGAEVSGVRRFPEHGVGVVFVNLRNAKIELIKPLGGNSSIARFLEKKPEGGIHHICLQVESVKRTAERLAKNDIRTLGDPRPGAHGKDIIFLHPQDLHGTLIELEDA